MSTIRISVVAALALFTPVTLSLAANDAALDARAKEIHAKVLTIDTHVDVLIPSTPQRYFVVYDISRTATPSTTVGARIVDSSYFTVTGQTNTRSFTFVFDSPVISN